MKAKSYLLEGTLVKNFS